MGGEQRSEAGELRSPVSPQSAMQCVAGSVSSRCCELGGEAGVALLGVCAALPQAMSGAEVRGETSDARGAQRAKWRSRRAAALRARRATAVGVRRRGVRGAMLYALRRK
jgi:hypothetical protein